ncbi:MAG: hypothetical protein R3A44_08095 [Caldilineaceae bacterium]
MIVVDESIQDPLITEAIATWYRGQVLSVRNLRPGTLVKDDAIPPLLRTAAQPTFVTINVDDFWRKVEADRRYCIVAIVIEQHEALKVPLELRRVLSIPELRTKANRMGKVLRVRPTGIEYYMRDRQVHFLPWST